MNVFACRVCCSRPPLFSRFIFDVCLLGVATVGVVIGLLAQLRINAKAVTVLSQLDTDKAAKEVQADAAAAAR